MGRWMAAGLILLAAGGCFRRPMQVCTDSRIRLVGPVSAQVTADLAPRRNAEPVTEMTVMGRELPASSPKVALIDVDGLLVNTNLTGPYSAGENPVDLFREKLDAAAADPKVRAVVVRINSPGGGVTATDLMWQQLRSFRQRTGVPVVAYLMDVGTGGAYYLACAADVICAHPTSITGGIGVILNLYNLQDAMAQFNLFPQPIKAGEQMDMGSQLGPLSDEARQWLQGMADEFHGRFREVVLSSRHQVPRDDPTIFDGRVFTASQAKARGLIDQIGYLEDAIRLAEARAGCAQARVVMYHRPDDPARSPFAITSNAPATGKFLPVSIPGLERSRLPAFLYLWQLDPTLERQGGM